MLSNNQEVRGNPSLNPERLRLRRAALPYTPDALNPCSWLDNQATGFRFRLWTRFVWLTLLAFGRILNKVVPGSKSYNLNGL